MREPRRREPRARGARGRATPPFARLRLSTLPVSIALPPPSATTASIELLRAARRSTRRAGRSAGSPRRGRGRERAARRSAPRPGRRGHARRRPESRASEHVVADDALELAHDAGPEDDARRVVVLPGYAPSCAELRHEGVLVLDGVTTSAGPRPCAPGSRPLTSSIAGPSAARRRATASPQPCDALDGLGRRVPAGQGDCAQVECARRCRLAADGVVRAVVDHDVLQVARPARADHGEARPCA